MCGFVGMFNRDPSLNYEKLLTTMSHAIRHRGPDESNFIVRDSFCAAMAQGVADYAVSLPRLG